MEQEIDIHNWPQQLSCAERKLFPNPISPRNLELIKRFVNHAKARGLSTSRITRYIFTLRQFAEWLSKDFDSATKEDIERIVAKLESSDYTPWTKHTNKAILKRFYKWLKGNDEEYPPEVKWIKITLKQSDQNLPRNLLTEDEIKKLVEATDNPRDRAFIMTLYETGARIGEIGTLRIRDIEFNQGYASVILKGKTGSRRVPIVASLPYLQYWIEHHPFKSNLNAPLWPKFSNGKPMTYPALAKVLKVAAQRANLKKRITPHLLRHSRATFLATKLTEAQMNAVFGWKQGSDMPQTYVHLSGRDVDQAILGIYGIKKSQENAPSQLQPKGCPRCGQTNPATAIFCFKCGMVLDIKTVVQIEERRREADELMSKLLEDPEVQKFLKKKLKRLLA